MTPTAIDLWTADLSPTDLDDYAADLSVTTIVELRRKGGRASYSRAASRDIDVALADLRERRCRALQITYRHESRTWIDTLLRASDSPTIRLVRRAED